MKVVLDAPCDDWNWMRFVDLAGTMSVPMPFSRRSSALREPIEPPLGLPVKLNST
jgi:hypothetical protein